MSFGMAYKDNNCIIMHAAKQYDGSLKFITGKEFVNTQAIKDIRAKLLEQAQK